MPLRKEIKRVLVIGSGPIVIGQAAEFDYAGSQVCRALMAAGLEVILVNSNPATIMTDKQMATEVYIEPLTLPVLKRIIKETKPDSLLSTMGGQTGLTLAMQLAKSGFLEAQNVRLLGARLDTIDKAEDRQLFKDMLESVGEPAIPSDIANTLDAALVIAQEIGYPVIVRPAYTLGGTGGGMAKNEVELRSIAEKGLSLSPIRQVLVEKSVSGWKEIEFELMRDSAGNIITVCSMENLDPVGVHTGDSVVVAPALTLADKEFQMLRSSAMRIAQALGIEGGCNIQYALRPDSFEYGVIEVNPRVSRSSALASKATGYPIAKVASLISIGYTLDEIPNAVTGKTKACFEPSIDYIVLKFPRWPFDKFVYANRELGTQMKATGEVMAIGQSLEEALMKAVRCLEQGMDDLNLPGLSDTPQDKLLEMLSEATDERFFLIYAALKKGVSPEQIFQLTGVDPFFTHKMLHIAEVEKALAQGPLDEERYETARRAGFTDGLIERYCGASPENPLPVGFKMVDTCAAEYEAETPYFYSSCDRENEASEFIQSHPKKGKKLVVFGSGPIRIGQGVEFDYCSVRCVQQLRSMGHEAILINNNPETVSTDFDMSDRLYFEPLTPDDVNAVLATEQPDGVVVQFGGQTAIRLAKHMQKTGVPIFGTSADAVDEAEDRERFDALTERLHIPRPKGETVYTKEEAVRAAGALGYPVLLRPSYVLGGQNMIIANSESDVREYMDIITGGERPSSPILIDQYLTGTEVEVDAICDGEDFLIPGIMEHIERAGIHSGDSISLWPPQNLPQTVLDTVVEYTGRFVRELGVVGLMNIQYVLHKEKVYVIEVNPRASRTVPFISKVTGIPAVDLATRALLGEKLKDMGWGTGLGAENGMVAVKVPVFSFPKLQDADTHLGPEMKSTGEVMGIDYHLENALFKGLLAAGYELHKVGSTVLFAVRDEDKEEAVPLAGKFVKLGYSISATPQTAAKLREHGIISRVVELSDDAPESTKALFDTGEVDFVVSTSRIGRKPARLSTQLRRRAIERNIATLTSLDTANALANCLLRGTTLEDCTMVDIGTIKTGQKS
ncbi:carbamoyl-phosphate synthase large subunit [Ruminococcaceae bacterium OttesenSCG-928-I18]|nr:carbamoyl-phosphate synthase large subunit [Ruminococcaceae bacterium OttesenSCG-928-I18]